MPYGRDEEQIQRHLVHCLEMHDGVLSTAVVQPDGAMQTLHDRRLTQKYR